MSNTKRQIEKKNSRRKSVSERPYFSSIQKTYSKPSKKQLIEDKTLKLL